MLAACLGAPATGLATAVSTSSQQLWGFGLWLGTHDRRSCAVTEERPADGAPGLLARAPFRWAAAASTAGIADSGGIALLLLDEPPPAEGRWTGQAALGVAGFGPRGAALAADLAALVQAWDQAGQPDAARLHVDAYPRSSPDLAEPGAERDAEPGGALLIERPATRFAIHHT